MSDTMHERSVEAAQEVLHATLAFTRDALAAPKWDRMRAAQPDEGAAARARAPQALPVLRWLNGLEAQAAPGSRVLCATLASAAPRLAWGQTYTAADFGAGFLERYGWMELVGRRGPFFSDSLALGFLLLGPGLEYPRHRHEAEEVYIVLSGTAQWLKAEPPFAPQAPGALIHHPPWCWHAMRTGDQALLALYLWRGGDLTQKSEIADQA